MLKKLVFGLGMMLAVLDGRAADLANDNAANTPYDDGWQSGDNGGSGFAPWTLNAASGGGFFVGSSTANAGGSGGIDTAGRAWGIFANGVVAEAIRPLSGGSLAVGQTITLQIDTGFIQAGGAQGFNLRDSAGNDRFSFFFQGGGTNYLYTDAAGGTNNSGIGFTGNGLSISFTLTGSDSYSATITPIGGSSTILSGMLAGTPGTGIVDLRFFNFNAGLGADAGFFVNNLAVIPEPSTISLLAGPALLGAWLMARRRRS